jgi:hypothetical protein
MYGQKLQIKISYDNGQNSEGSFLNGYSRLREKLAPRRSAKLATRREGGT